MGVRDTYIQTEYVISTENRIPQFHHHVYKFKIRHTTTSLAKYNWFNTWSQDILKGYQSTPNNSDIQPALHTTYQGRHYDYIYI